MFYLRLFISIFLKDCLIEPDMVWLRFSVDVIILFQLVSTVCTTYGQIWWFDHKLFSEEHDEVRFACDHTSVHSLKLRSGVCTGE